VLTGVICVGIGTMLALHHHTIVGWPVIIATVIVWAAVSVVLRVRADTWGKERPVIDWWSVPHFGAGVLLAMFGTGGAIVIGVAALWEGVELVSRVDEYPTNRVADIALAFAGWVSVNLIAGGPFAAW
jgi:hypothetical protein